MPATSFECQIARGQIGRYVEGGLLSPDAMRGLEEHLGECPECKGLVAERRSALLDKLGGKIPTHAVVSMPVVEENPLLKALRARSEVAEGEEDLKPATKATPRYQRAPKAPKSAKPVKNDSEPKPKQAMSKSLVLGALLSVVLISMSYLTRSNGGQGVLGGKAADTFAASTLSDKPAPTATAITPPASVPIPAPTTTPVATKPDETKPTETKPVDTKPVDPATANPDSRETPAVAAPVNAAQTTEPVKTVVASTTPAVPAKPVTKPIVKEPAPIVAKPVAAHALAPKPIVHRARRRNAARKPVVRRKAVSHKAKRTRRSSTTVRVYGLDGQPLKP